MRVPGFFGAILVCSLLFVSCAGNEPAPEETIQPPDEAAAIAVLKEINQAQADFIRRTRRYAQTYDELIAEHLLATEPSSRNNGYEFLLRPSPDAVSYKVLAIPRVPNARHFFTDQTGVIRAEFGTPASEDSPEL